MNGTNGAPHGATSVPPELAGLAGTTDFDFVKLRRLVVLAIGHGQRKVADARTVVAQAAEVIRQGEDELRRLRRVLALLEEEAPPAAAIPPPTRHPGRDTLTPIGRGTRLGGGTGRRAGTYLLEVARQRHATSGDATFTRSVAQLACKGWPARTVNEGLQRLLEDGMVRRVRIGHYELTEWGLRQPPAAAADLPLLAPREPAEATA